MASTTNPPDPIPSIAQPSPPTPTSTSTPPSPARGRPPLTTRASSGTMITSRTGPPTSAALEYESSPSDPSRTLSPRRAPPEIEQLGEAARRDLENQARELQKGLMEIVERVETVKSEHARLEGGNKFLQSYIGELMSTSKVMSSGGGKGKKGGRK
ncbi:hypothetical protein B0A48_03473 [Cryoendolithus antarcticus]|uniref:BZIP transcription factor n=1 Tax=Cryoendolithus antarcticus TaxID=1507870 RepID=A0A1V8TK40_9PEZI|nr:hypothetical protein B0A48_03473 [Cryoendolithus antarcticus]